MTDDLTPSELQAALNAPCPHCGAEPWGGPSRPQGPAPDLRDLLAKATPGPWRWHGQIGPYHSIGLRTVGNGVLYVMGAKRLGMQGAEFTFWRRSPDERWGWNGNMETASEIAVREVPYRNDIVDLDNPNAQLIVAAVNALPALLDVVDAARSVTSKADPDEDFDGEFIEYLVPFETIDALRDALRRLDEGAS